MPTPPDPRNFAPDTNITDHLQWGAQNEATTDIRDQLAQHLGEITRYAGGLILEAVARGFGVYRKRDGSSYTDADIEAESFILKSLTTHFPDVPILAEEQSAAREEAGKAIIATPLQGAFFLVDALDGTRDFSTGGLEYTVNIAAIVNGMPVAGAVYAPASGNLWIGGTHAFVTTSSPYNASPSPADWQLIRTRQVPPDGMTALASRRHGEGRTGVFLARLPIREFSSASSSVKFCLLAQGDADVYPRFGPTMEWDTAAGDAVLRAAGGIVVDEKGRPLVYGRIQNSYVNGPFIAWGDPAKSKEFCS